MLDTIKNRRSIRKYKSDMPVTQKQIGTLLEAAMYAPSAGNSRPWEFIVVTQRELLNNIAKSFDYAKMCETATAVIVVAAIPEKSRNHFPADCAAATQNILLAAHELGLGACWCGMYPNKEKMQLLASLLSVDSSAILFCVIAIGIPDESPDARGFYEKEKVTYIK